MVSRSILNDYYDIPLNCTGFFEYQGINYYLTRNCNWNLYKQYINASQFPAFLPVKNIFNQYLSQEYLLFSYTNNNIDIENLIKYSLKPVSKKSVHQLKKSWIRIMNEVYEYQQNKMIFHYNFALGQLAIELLNHLFEKDKEILMGIEHGYAFPDVKNICNPDNIIMAPRIQDLSCLYMLDFITDAQLTDIIIQYHLDFNDLAILLCHTIYPHSFYINVLQQCISDQKERKRLNNHIIHIRKIISVISQFIEIPDIFWLK